VWALRTRRTARLSREVSVERVGAADGIVHARGTQHRAPVLQARPRDTPVPCAHGTGRLTPFLPTWHHRPQSVWRLCRRARQTTLEQRNLGFAPRYFSCWLTTSRGSWLTSRFYVASTHKRVKTSAQRSPPQSSAPVSHSTPKNLRVLRH
jgi:hypothetical protein